MKRKSPGAKLRRVEALQNTAGKKAEDGSAKETATPVYRPAYRYAKKPRRSLVKALSSRKAMIGIVGAVVIVAAALVCFLAFFLNRQQPIEGSWAVQTEDTPMYLTIYEDNTVIVTTGEYNVYGTVERKEGDILAFQVKMATQDVLTGDFRYRSTRDTLTLTPQQGSSGIIQPEELAFTRLDHDITQVDPPQPAEVDPAIVGVWSDQQAKLRYTFEENGKMRMELLTLGVSVNGTYLAKDGWLTLGKLADGQMVDEETEYTLTEQGNLMIGKIEFIKENE